MGNPVDKVVARSCNRLSRISFSRIAGRRSPFTPTPLGDGDAEPWIVDQPWKAVTGGWSVPGELQGWRFRLEVMPDGVRVVASMGKGEPMAWTVPQR